MFCPKCGSKIEGTNICSNCSFDASSVESNMTPSAPPVVESPPTTSTTLITHTENTIIIKKIVFIIIGAVVLFMFFSAASKISESGLNIMNIQSVGGTTLEEAYYFELGGIYEGYATIARALGIFFGSALVWLGLKK